MSTVMSQARVRVPRFAEAAVERARLTVVPTGRTQAARTPFVVLVLGVLAAGVVGLLMFNTSMQQRSFLASSLQAQETALNAKEQGLSMELQALRDPQHLAAEAKHLGMVPPTQPAFIRLSDGTVLGNPVPATSANRVRINPEPSTKPSSINPPPIIVRVPAAQNQAQSQAQNAAQAPATTSGTSTGTGTASTGSTATQGRKKSNTNPAAH